MADGNTVLLTSALRRGAGYRELGYLPDRALDGVAFSLEIPPCEEEEPPRHLLEGCFLCSRQLRVSSDVFMYKGDTPFCSEECRQEQIQLDEARERETRYRRRRHQHHRASSMQQAPASARQSLYAPASDAIVTG